MRLRIGLSYCVKADIVSATKLQSLRKETDELLAIFVTIVTKVKQRTGKQLPKGAKGTGSLIIQNS